MTDLFTFFDPYTLRATVFPALIGGLPILAMLIVIVPWDHLGLPHGVAAALALILLFAFADVARRTGKRVQARLKTGMTPEQWRRDDPDLAEVAKDRYRNFIAQKLERSAPSAEEERSDPDHTRDFYLSAGNWLRENTRDTRIFRILFNENITYGFRRNLLGLKPIALSCNMAVAAICAAILMLHPPYFSTLSRVDDKIVVVLATVLLHSTYMLLAVNRIGVKDASRAYGRQLILSCETLMVQRPPAPRKNMVKNGGR